MSSSRSSTASERPNPVNVAGPRAACGRSGKPGDYIFTLRHDGLERRYRVHVPANYDATRPAAVLVALHGGGGDMEYQANDVRYGLISKSDSAGFIAVFPNGTRRMKRGMFATWNAGNCCAHARDASVDDVCFIREVVEDVSRQGNVDRGRIHAKNDTHVLFNGGAGPDTRYLTPVTAFTWVPATIPKWVGLEGCPAVPKRVLDKPGAYCDLYAPCRGDTRGQSCDIRIRRSLLAGRDQAASVGTAVDGDLRRRCDVGVLQPVISTMSQSATRESGSRFFVGARMRPVTAA